VLQDNPIFLVFDKAPNNHFTVASAKFCEPKGGPFRGGLNITNLSTTLLIMEFRLVSSPSTALPALLRLPYSVRASATTPAGTDRCICRLLRYPLAAFSLLPQSRRPHYSFQGLLDFHSRSRPHGP